MDEGNIREYITEFADEQFIVDPGGQFTTWRSLHKEWQGETIHVPNNTPAKLRHILPPKGHQIMRAVMEADGIEERFILPLDCFTPRIPLNPEWLRARAARLRIQRHT